MSLAQTIDARFQKSFQLYRDLVKEVDESAFQKKLPQIPSNTIGQQLWCVVGARESYCRALTAQRWSGFTCSLSAEQIKRKPDLLKGIKNSEELVNEQITLIDSFTDTQNEMILQLLEHECAHHGQLIRYFYGLRLPIPQSWQEKYSLK